MTQTRLGSLVEVVVNTIIGYAVNFAANLLVFPAFGHHITWQQNVWIGLIFTVISVARSYVIRRWFNARLHRWAHSFGRPC